MVNTIFDFSTATSSIKKITDNKVIVNGAGFIRTNNFKTSGKWCFEFLIISNSGATLGLCSDEKLNAYPGVSATSYGINIHNSNWWNTGYNSSSSNWIIHNGDIVGFCIDFDNKLLNLYINGKFIIEKQISNIKDKCFISVGSGGASGGIIELITNRTDMKYFNDYPSKYKSWDSKNKYLIKQNNQYHTIKTNLHPLGQPTDNIQLKTWFDKHGVDDINILTETLSKKETPMTKGKTASIWKTAFELDANDITGNIELTDIDENNKSIKYDCNNYRILDLLQDKFDIMMLKEK